MRLHILFLFKKSPWGGANQFLLALRSRLRQQGNYHDDPDNADAIVVNLNPGNLLSLTKQVFQIKSRHPDKITIARVDGPISLIRGRDDKLDRLLFNFINLFADGVIYQSRWSKKANDKLVQTKAPYETVIHNAADSKIFYPNTVSDGWRCPGVPRRAPAAEARTHGGGAGQPTGPVANTIRHKLIATSWSPNIRKGFDIYQYLDQHLDFSRHSMTFVGNSPVKFKNIQHINPVPSLQLADLLRQHDIYITASQNDPCSNALIEAMACGLPPVALARGGHPELIQHGGELFTSQSDVILKINLVAQNLLTYQANLPQLSIAKATQGYLNFARKINSDIRQGTYYPKHTTPLITKIKTAKIKALYHLHTSPGLQFP